MSLLCTCGKRLSSAAPVSARASAPRTLHAPAGVAPESRVPSPRGPYSDPEALLKVSKRGLQAHAQLFPDWRSLFLATGPALKEQGLAPKERRYLLWYLEKFRQGGDPAEYDIAPKPRKKIRGWGPAVQHGVRIRP